MKANVKKLWVKALRSGTYKKGIGSLKTKQGKYCCLGVLCDVYRKTTGKGKWISDGHGPRFYAGINGFSGVLPPAVQRWAGLTNKDPRIGAHNASFRNDSLKNSFRAIANLIEKHL